ncbi:MAG: SDR family oxidoreductase [Chlamydiales bacterium]|nr:SDR family oxidoreductase [Chlamydiales bacterium]
MRALVTGGAGFIGSHLVERLLQEGHEVIVLDNLAGGHLKNLRSVQNHPAFSFEKVDIRNIQEIEPFFNAVDWVFHLAAMADIVPSIEKPDLYYEVNVNGTFNVLECAKRAKVKRFVYVASSSCYGIAKEYPTQESATISPEYPYALTKNLGEQLVMHWEKLYHLPAVSLRFFNVYGPRSRTTGAYGAVFGVFLAQKLNNRPYTVVGDGKQTRDFTYVTDVVDAVYKAACSELSGKIFNVGSSGHYSVNRLVELLGGDVVYIPKRPGEPDCTFADVSKIQAELGWKASISFEEGIKKMLEHIDEFRDAPLWDPESIKVATASWFRYLDPKKDECICS